jgi:Protein of unknown function (DUF1344)
MFTRSLAVIAALCALVFVVAPALAAELEGKIQSVNASERTITLDNGTTVWLADGISTSGLQEGAEVKVSIDDRDGKQVATSVDVK